MCQIFSVFTLAFTGILLLSVSVSSCAPASDHVRSVTPGECTHRV